MSTRTTRKTGTITLVIEAKSDKVDNLPVPSPPHGGGTPTREWQGGQTDDELATSLEAWVNDWFEKQFPQPLHGSQIEFDSISVVIT